MTADGGFDKMGASEPDRKQPRRSPWAVAVSAGSELVAAVLLGAFAGRWADERLDTEPWLTLIGIFLGIGVGIYLLIRETVGESGGPKRG